MTDNRLFQELEVNKEQTKSQKERYKVMTDSRIIKIVAVIVIIALVSGGVGFYVWNKTTAYYEENPVILESTVTKTMPARPQIVEKEVSISEETLRSGLDEIGVLDTAEYYFTHCTKYSENAQFLGCEVPFSESSYIYSYDGRITAGVDFTEITVEVDENDRVITITLPPVMITGFEIDTDSFTLYDERISILNQISVEAMADTIGEIELDEREKAVDKGILETAEKNAQILVENFANGLYGSSGYTIVVESSGVKGDL